MGSGISVRAGGAPYWLTVMARIVTSVVAGRTGVVF
jgi:hypothetical protein